MLPLLAVLALSLGPARAVAPVVSGPYAIAGTLDVATDGELMLAVWADGRSRDTYEVKAARIGPDGVVLDPGGIAVTHHPEHRFAYDPRVVWDGERFVVAWGDEQHNVSAAAVSRNGEVTAAVQIAERNNEVTSLAANGGRVLAVINASSTPPHTSVGLIGDDLLFAETLRFDEFLARPTVAPLGNGFVLLWVDTTANVHARKIDIDGHAAGDPFVVTALGTFTNVPSVAAETGDDGEVVIAASDLARVAITRLHPDGTTSGSGELTGDAGQRYVDAIVPHAGGADVVGRTFVGPVVLSFDGNGTLVRQWQPFEDHFISAGGGAATRGLPYAVWIINRQVLGAFTSAAGSALDLISDAPRAQLMPAVATNGSSTVAAWHESQDGTLIDFEVMASIDGGEPIRIGESIDDRLSPPAVTFDGHDWVFAWKNDLVSSEQLYQRLLVRRLSPDGTLGETQTISTIAHDAYGPAIASDGTDVLLAWCEGAWFQAPYVRVQLLGHDTFTMPGGYGTPSIAFDGTRYLVAATNGTGDIIGMFVERSGAAGAPFVIAHDADPYFGWPSVAWNGERYLVVYHQPFSWTGAQYVSGEGAPIGATFFLGYTSIAPRVTAHDGTFVVYRDGKLERIGEAPVEIGEGSMEAALAPGVVVYSHHVEELQRVPRVFTRNFGGPRGRAVRH